MSNSIAHSYRKPAGLLLLLTCLKLAGCASAQRSAEPGSGGVGQRYIVLVPLTLNDGSPAPAGPFQRFQDQVFERVGGITVAGEASGLYRMADGRRAEDRLRVVWVVVEPDDVAWLRSEVAALGRALGQESMYFERGDGQVEFIESAEVKTPR